MRVATLSKRNTVHNKINRRGNDFVFKFVLLSKKCYFYRLLTLITFFLIH